jgi:uncharacterized protein YecE (DUF72 family)
VPPLKEVENWRKLVPSDFEFAVRVHRSMMYKYELQPIEGTFVTFKRMKQICMILDAEILHLQVSVFQRLVKTLNGRLRNLLPSLNLQGLRLALEIRGAGYSQLPSQLLKTMQEYDIVHCVDLSKGETPAYQSDILYTRLFGKGEQNVYQPTDEELSEIDKRASGEKSEKVVMSFHFVKMYRDAARLKTYKQTGKFPMVTRSTGSASFEEVLGEDARFPSTKQELMRSQGWKLFDLTETERIRVGDMLEKLPEATYRNLSEVAERLKPMME